MAFIELRNVAKTFHSGRVRREVLDNINLFVEEGEFVSIVGYTGSGKSTLLAIAAGLLAADRGQIRLAGDLVTKFSAQAFYRFPELLAPALVLRIGERASGSGRHVSHAGLVSPA